MGLAARPVGAWRRCRASASEETDLLAEHEVWRVLAASGASGSPGVYELDNARGTGGWRLRAVVD